jgi:hypothetical protein
MEQAKRWVSGGLRNQRKVYHRINLLSQSRHTMNLHKLISIGVSSALLLLPALSFAQDNADGWPVEQRCAAEAVVPPDDWTFNGTIFTRDLDGIRAINAAFPTTYFVIFSSEFLKGAALSPDGRWYAIPSGTLSPAADTIPDYYYHVQKIDFYSTDAKREHRSIPWDMTFRSSIETIRWLDDEYIFYRSGHHYGGSEYYKINTISGEKTKVEVPARSIIPSPDGSRAFYRDEQTLEFTLYNTATNETLVHFAENTQNFLHAYPQWSPDSTRFVGVVTDERNGEVEPAPAHVNIYDRDGSLMQSIKWDTTVYNPNLSGNNAYLSWSDNEGNFFVADLDTKTITDYCNFPRYSQVLSPDGKQLAFSYQNTVYVLDLTSAQIYVLPYIFSHSPHGYQIQSYTDVVAWGQN